MTKYINTETAIKRLPAVTAEKLHTCGDGLYLRQSPTGRLTWVYRAMTRGNPVKRNLGTYPALSMAQAKAETARLNLKAQPATATAADVARDWFEKVIEPNYRVTKNIEVYVSRFERAFGRKPIQSLSKPELVAELEAYAKTSPVAANRCRSNWKMLFDYASERGLIDSNPLSGTTNRIAGGTEKSRDRTLTDDEIIALWHDGHEHGALLRFLLLTGLRISEAQGAQTIHIDGDKLLITENKSDRPHWVYLTKAAKEQICDYEGYLFEPRSNTAVQSRLKRLNMGWTPHDLRRTFATRLAGLGCPVHIVEKLLNHSMQGVAAIYNRFDYEPERIEWSQKLSDDLEALTNG